MLRKICDKSPALPKQGQTKSDVRIAATEIAARGGAERIVAEGFYLFLPY